MSTVLQTLRGFRDFLAADVGKRRWLISKIQTVFERFGFEPIETPALEYEALLLGKYGEEADKLIFSFEDRGGRRVALRYDQTVPTARIIAQYRNELTFPFKRYQIQPVWRSDKPQKGRFREFYQCDADIIGSTSNIADAEILAVYAAIYYEIGLTSIKIKVNDRQYLIQTIKNNGIPEEKIVTVIQTIDKLDKKTQVEVLEELVQKGIEKNNAINLLSSLKNSVMPPLLESILEQALRLGVKKETFIFEPTLARGLDYYTGLIFEGIIPEYAVGSVGGGGRYDNLIKDLVDVQTPAVGFGLGFDRTLEAAEELGKIPDVTPKSEVMVTIFSPETVVYSLNIVNTLREKGIKSDLFMDQGKKLDAQLKYADKKKIQYVIIAGPDEVTKKTVLVKNMKTREQKEVVLSELMNFFTLA